jgi:hypothetical protein
MILVPALMSILDRRAWWLPAWLDRIIPDLKLEGGEESEPTRAPVPVAASALATPADYDGADPGAVDRGAAEPPPAEQPPAVPTP